MDMDASFWGILATAIYGIVKFCWPYIKPVIQEKLFGSDNNGSTINYHVENMIFNLPENFNYLNHTQFGNNIYANRHREEHPYHVNNNRSSLLPTNIHNRYNNGIGYKPSSMLDKKDLLDMNLLNAPESRRIDQEQMQQIGQREQMNTIGYNTYRCNICGDRGCNYCCTNDHYDDRVYNPNCDDYDNRGYGSRPEQNKYFYY